MIKTLSVKSFKSLFDVNLEFTQLNAIVGQNNTGKTTLLKAISVIAKIPQVERIEDAFGDDWKSSEEIVSNGMPGLEISFEGIFEHFGKKFEYSSKINVPRNGKREADLMEETLNGTQLIVRGQSRAQKQSQVFAANEQSNHTNHKISKEFLSNFKDPKENDLNTLNAEVIQLNPHFLRMPTKVAASKASGKETGTHFPELLMSILLNDRNSFDLLEADFLILFPAIKSVHISHDKKMQETALYFTLAGGNRVPARSMSDGVLMVLGLLSILYANTARKIFLIEELETHFHFSILEKIIQLFRTYLENNIDSQIIFTTHSPYLLNYLEPEEVIVVNMNDKYQTEIRKFDKYSKVEKLRNSFGTGDIWALAGEAKIFDELTQNNGQLKENLKEGND